MPCLLLPGADCLIREQLRRIEVAWQGGERIKPGRIVIAQLTTTQFEALNRLRAATNRPPLPGVSVNLDGRHFFESRRIGDGYTIEDMLEQVISALDSDSVARVERRHPQYVNMVSRRPRVDGYGNLVTDAAVFNADSRAQVTELFSVIPHGDARKPAGQKKRATAPPRRSMKDQANRHGGQSKF
jgi:hypothetical protein